MSVSSFRMNLVEGFTVTVRSGEEQKKCRLRFPTDQEWEERVRKVKVLRTAVGRDKYQSDAPGEKAADAELFNRIWLDRDGQSQSFDDAEASRAISKIDNSRVLSAEQDGGRYRITLEVPTAEVMALLRPPSRKQVDEYERRSMTFLSGRRTQEFRSTLEPAKELFDALVVETEGYPDPCRIPIIHKFAFITELLTQCEEAVGEGIELPEEPCPAATAVAMPVPSGAETN